MQNVDANFKLYVNRAFNLAKVHEQGEKNAANELEKGFLSNNYLLPKKY